ncbi:hypothetical protein L249_8624 [Ophiocordyceps polyrhachis-furcata BCC 54312]|uniref:Threonine/serine exporter-like N-terminal domain-containing protein n=1 Tax=Ophiocordyceps polyrhachis-furcata BCC 54312 TaxID=1330021 RepID=A0A367L6W0_9HYPO|nr:hypothetical protein L249_8624 [Ophiocordyceps polyrhachis-furcata BCC 54312]
MAGEPTSSSSQPSDVPTPSRKPKKRVGWHSSSNSGGGGVGSGEGGVGSGGNDGSASRSPLASPGRPLLSNPPGAPDAHELVLALTKVLSDEREQQREWQQAPRPALRRNTSYDAPEEREKADQAEQRATQRQLRSLTDARQRADRLAISVVRDSAPGSRRTSHDLEAAFQPLMDDPDDVDESDAATSPDSRLDDTLLTPHCRRRNIASEDHVCAESLVQSHTLRDRARGLFHRKHSSPAGHQAQQQHHHHHHQQQQQQQQQHHHQDYVSRPPRYRGGILSSLLRLYNDDRGAGGGSNNSSGFTTPTSPATPLMSPRPSPPPSRPASTAGGPRVRSGGGLFGHSTTSLSELIKSSSMLAAPVTSEVHDQWADKIRRERPQRSSRKERARITVHIAGIISRHRYLLKLCRALMMYGAPTHRLEEYLTMSARLCRALMMYGAPTHRLEEYLTMSARVLEIEGQFLYIPSCMLVSFDDSTTHTTEVKVVRVPQGIDLGKLRDVHNIYKDVVHDKLGVEEATRRLDEVMQRKPKFHTWMRVPVYGIASACVAPFAFEGRFIDLPIAFILGCIVGLLQLVFAPSNELYAHVFEVSAAVITSFLARGFGSIQQGKLFCFSALAQSSIALILPGYMVLCSSLELQSHNIVAGSVRMVHAMIYTLFLGYGITIGASLYGMMDKNATSDTHCRDPLTRPWYFIFVAGFTLSLCVLNQAKWRQTPTMTFMALAGFCVNTYCSIYFEQNTQISNMLGALTIGILANLYSRLGRHIHNYWLNLVEWWECRMRPRFSRRRRPAACADNWSIPSMSDPESRPSSPEKPVHRQQRKVGYSLAAAAMLPAIFVQVPSGLAAGGSLLAGVTSANALNGNPEVLANGGSRMGGIDSTAFNVLFSVIQVAIGISVGLFMSALIVYPLGKRRSGLFSF